MTTAELTPARPAPSAASSPRAARVCVGVATRGRPQQVAEVVRRLRAQTLAPTAIFVACVEPADVEGLSPAPDLWILYSAPGLTRQRNAVLDHLPADTDYVVFFDDDFVPDPSWLEVVSSQFEADVSLVCITGHVVADGILGPGLSFAEAEAAVRDADRTNLGWRIEGYSPYGCNMAFRAAAIGGRRFDERLVLYGWLEDRDFGAQIARDGRLIKLGAALGAHLGVKRGRVSGRRLGYSQVANPAYLCAKGTMSLREATVQIARNLAKNLARSAWPEPYIDRRGRLLGNARALFDLARGVFEPERAERL